MMNQEAQSGFDCDFVEKPPKAIQSECPVCLLIVREPHQATCCGYSYCKHCIDRIKATNDPCPCCKTERFKIFEDKRLERSLYELKVHCSNKSQGCQWVGELRQLDNHINAKPSQTKLLEGCKYTRVPCAYCHVEQRRSSIQTHQNDLCPKRPFRCAYCNQYTSDYEDVSSKHWLTCGYYPVPCPNQCGVRILRRDRNDLERHVADKCHLTKVDCYFKYAGCEVKVSRQDMKEHLDITHPPIKEGRLHPWKLSDNDDRKYEKLRSARSLHQLRPKPADEKWLIIDNNATIGFLLLVVICGFFYFHNKTTELQNNVAVKTQEVLELSQEVLALRSRPSVCPTILTFANFTEHYDKDEAWISSPFYTHPRGYKMCLKVYAKGYGEAKGTDISVIMFMMQGNFDNELNWPFRGSVTVQLLNRTKDLEPYKPKTYHFAGRESAKRVMGRKRAKKGVVFQKFVPNETKLWFLYAKYDSLKFSLKYKP